MCAKFDIKELAEGLPSETLADLFILKVFTLRITLQGALYNEEFTQYKGYTLEDVLKEMKKKYELLVKNPIDEKNKTKLEIGEVLLRTFKD